MKLVQKASTLVGFALLGACSADTTGLQPPASLAVQAPLSPDEAGADLVARAFAMGMRDPSVRSGVRDAMRASLVTEHKLVVQEFVGTPNGRALLSSGAERLGVSVESLEKTIAQLPALDFYVPSKAHRRGWRSEASIRVGAVRRNGGAMFKAYDVNGGGGNVFTAFEQPGGATFKLERAERKSRRIDPQASVPGAAIEDPNDGVLSGSFVEYLPDGSTKVTELADYVHVARSSTQSTSPANVAGASTWSIPDPRRNIEPCAPNCPPPGGSADTTFLRSLIVIHVCDNLDCGQGNEFEWHTYFSTNNGATWGNRFDLRLEGISSTYEETILVPALLKKIRSSGQKVQSDVVETDPLGDDHFTDSPQWAYGQASMLVSEGTSRCGYPRNYGGTYDCYDQNLFPYREVNQNMTWSPF